MADIKADEVAVYDRQLRLWGVQAQQRLLKSKVLIWGMEGSNVEVAKNLVLAGVALEIRDHRLAAGPDVAFNYFLRPEDVGKNRGDCAAKRVQEMNPLCTVDASAQAPNELPWDNAAGLREALKSYNFVVVSLGALDWNVDRARHIDNACRELKAGFALTVSCGELALFFSDLGSHVVEERSSTPGAEQQEAPEPETVEYPSFADWLDCGPVALQKQKADASFQLFALLMGFLRSGGRAAPEAGVEFAEYCRDKAKCEPAVDGFATLQDAFPCFFLEPLVSVASVLAGLLSQEVIKGLTKRDLPMANTICFNAHGGAALVERIPAAQKEVKKRKVEEVADLLD